MLASACAQLCKAAWILSVLASIGPRDASPVGGTCQHYNGVGLGVWPLPSTPSTGVPPKDAYLLISMKCNRTISRSQYYNEIRVNDSF